MIRVPSLLPPEGCFFLDTKVALESLRSRILVTSSETGLPISYKYGLSPSCPSSSSLMSLPSNLSPYYFAAYFPRPSHSPEYLHVQP